MLVKMMIISVYQPWLIIADPQVKKPHKLMVEYTIYLRFLLVFNVLVADGVSDKVQPEATFEAFKSSVTNSNGVGSYFFQLKTFTLKIEDKI
jgi:hypothetical protein